ncbi:ferredoxin-type protein NapF [Luteimonas sp. SDU82]|uniref:ferredoxin-type protein NapF n=1 Tax=Luteimonas sp. SDU82 TaxID=3422592 RepID=UPI003EBB108A
MADATIERCRPTRRALLRGRLHDEPTLRPPWALDGSRFSDACTGCGDCVSACQQQVLVRGAGGLPVFEPAQGECTFCGDCASVCEAGLFAPLAQRPWTLRAQVGSACLAMSGVVCFSCRDACGDSAIRFAPARTVPVPEVLADHCTGCGACVSGCPTAAISLAAGETIDG